MNILVQRTTIWAIAAFFGCVSLLGPGWHCVFGHHFHGSESCAHVDSAAADCRSHCCATPPLTIDSTPQTDSADRGDGPAVQALAHPAHHCPLCQFFGTAQWSQADAPSELVLVATELLTPAAPTREREAPRLYLSRAPPRTLTHC
jgi:hypothetical protein